MNNASFRYIERIKQLRPDAGVKLVYLPYHSPGLNPIEEPFSELKALRSKIGHSAQVLLIGVSASISRSDGVGSVYYIPVLSMIARSDGESYEVIYVLRA